MNKSVYGCAAVLLLGLLSTGCAGPDLRDVNVRGAIKNNPVSFWAGLGCALASGACYAVARNQSDGRYAWTSYGIGISLDLLAFGLFAYTFKDALKDDRRRHDVYRE